MLYVSGSSECANAKRMGTLSTTILFGFMYDNLCHYFCFGHLRRLNVPQDIHEMWLKGDRKELARRLVECGLDKEKPELHSSFHVDSITIAGAVRQDCEVFGAAQGG